MTRMRWRLALAAALVAASPSLAWSDPPPRASGAPQVVVISLDGAKPDLIREYLRAGVLDKKTGLGRIERHGVVADQNVTATPSLTAVSHIAIATGSTSAHNNIPANTFHPVAAAISATISGFAAPIGGYSLNPVGPDPTPTAEPLWVRLRAAGKTVVTATWPGGDGASIQITGVVVQPAVPTRTVDYTVPFGAFGGLGAQGFTLTAASFTAAAPALVDQLAAAGHVSQNPVRVTAAPVETVFCAPAAPATCGTTSSSGRTLRYEIFAAALDTTADDQLNYDTLVLFDGAAGIPPGPFALPSTGPAYVQVGRHSARFFFEGSGSKVGAAYFLSFLAPDLATVRLARYSANFIPRNAPVLADVDDVNEHVGFWGPQPDFRIPERLSPGFADFPDPELEAMYLDQVTTFTAYQTAVALRAIARNPQADLVMIYFEQPDGSGHQFTLTDPRQATDPRDNRTVGRPGQPAGAIGQDAAKVARYAEYVQFAYQQASGAVEAVIQAVGTRPNGEPARDVLVVSDHGMAPFHTAVTLGGLGGLLQSAGFDLSRLAVRTSGPAANIYVNLAGRESGGTVDAAEYATLVAQLTQVLGAVKDPSAFYNPGGRPLFGRVWARPSDCGRPGFCTDATFGQDTGDVLALLDEGYNFDGTQGPVVPRLGDAENLATVYSVPNFYGAHGHDSALPSMSAILYAAGPSFKQGNRLGLVRNIDIAPTVLEILGVDAPSTVDGSVIPDILRKPKKAKE
jgi:hypothetical protein